MVRNHFRELFSEIDIRMNLSGIVLTSRPGSEMNNDIQKTGNRWVARGNAAGELGGHIGFEC